MKKKGFWGNFIYGFVLAEIILASVILSVVFMAKAEMRTRETGFGGKENTKILYIEEETGILRIFGWEFNYK